MLKNNIVTDLFLRLSWKKFLLALLFGFALSLLFAAQVVDYFTLGMSNDAKRIARERMVLYSGGLRSALNKVRYLPHVLATHPIIVRFITQRDNMPEIGAYLEDINFISGSMDLFVLDESGTAIAASNWRLPSSFVGYDYSYRPYYIDAMSKGSGGYYGVGATTGNPGYFFTERIDIDDHTVGVAVTKVDLRGLQQEWKEGGETVFITDANGIIFLSSRDEWLYRATRPLEQAEADAIRYQRQYGNSLPELISLSKRFANNIEVIWLGGQNWVFSTQDVPEYGWVIWYLTPFSSIQQRVDQLWFMSIVISFMLALLVLLTRLALAWAGMRRSAREAEKIRRVNTRLAKEIHIREQAEKDLLAAQAELLHAGRLSALGQMAASVAHELSQPVTSMQMFASSCRRFARSGDCTRVEQTVEHMLSLLQRFKDLIGQLKHFSRKTPAVFGEVSLSKAIQNVLTMLEHKRNIVLCEPSVECPPGLAAQGDAMWLEQVLTNLVENALDAVGGLPPGEQRLVRIEARTERGNVLLCVYDNGPGIDEALLENIFSPFVTSKKSGEGIGLGLAIVDNIVHSMRGSITARNLPDGGACFTVQLPRG